MNVSLVLCTYNRSDLLRRSLETVAAQGVPEGIAWEAVVVDNASTDDTPDVAAEFAASSPNIRHVREAKQGLSHARNRGIEDSTGELICFIDDDVRLPPDYVKNAHVAGRNADWGVAGGRVIADYEAPPPKWVDRLPPSMLNGPFGLHDRGEQSFLLDDDDEIVPIGANMLIPRAALRKIGNFNTELGRTGGKLRSGEDSELYERAREAGMKIGYCGSCSLRHFVARERLTRRFFLRWKFAGALVGGNETLPADTTFWFRVPRYVWRSFIESALRLVPAVVIGRRFQRLVEFTGTLGQVIGYVSGRRKYTIARSEPPAGAS